MIIKLLVLADVHVGSIYGLTPRKYFNEHTNSYQLWAINKWEEFIQKYKYPDYLILNGDIVDGPGGKDATTLCIPDMEDQVNSAVELLSPLVGKNTIIYGCSGSGYHTGKGTGFDADRQITQNLITLHNVKGNHYKKEFNLSLSKYNMPSINFRHQGKTPSSEITAAFKRYYKTNTAKIGMIVASHLHRIYEAHDGVKIIHTPCWQWETAFMGSDNPLDIGATLIQVDIDQKTIKHEFIEYIRPQELFEDMQHWEDISLERETELRKIEVEQNKKEVEKLSKKFKEIPKVTIEKIRQEIKKEDSIQNLSLPSIAVEKRKEEKKKEIKFPEISSSSLSRKK